MGRNSSFDKGVGVFLFRKTYQLFCVPDIESALLTVLFALLNLAVEISTYSIISSYIS